MERSGRHFCANDLRGLWATLTLLNYTLVGVNHFGWNWKTDKIYFETCRAMSSLFLLWFLIKVDG